MKITYKLGDLLDALAEWLGLVPQPIPVRIPHRKEKKR